MTGRYTGFCFECRLYHSLTGEYRPKKYCGKRWCDCGNEATQQVELSTGSLTKKGNLRAKIDLFFVCNDCYQLEMS